MADNAPPVLIDAASSEAAIMAKLSATDGIFAASQRDSTWASSFTLNLSPSEMVSRSTGGRVVFNIEKTPAHTYLFLQDVKLVLNIKMTFQNGKAPPTTMRVAPICDFANTMFGGLTVYINESSIPSCNNGYYHYLNYFNKVLNNNTDRKNTILTPSGYYEDLAGDKGTGWFEYDSTLPGSGWKKRREMFGQWVPAPEAGGEPTFHYLEHEVTVIGEPQHELKSQRVPLPPGVGARLEFIPLSAGHAIQSNQEDAEVCQQKNLDLEVTKATLIVPYKVMEARLSLEVEKILKKHPLELNMKRVDIRTYAMAAGQQNFYQDLTVSKTGVNPDRILVAICNGHQMSNPYGVSPFFFANYIPGKPDATTGKHDDRAFLTSTRLKVNATDVDAWESRGSPTEVYLKHYLNLFETLGLSNSETGLNLPYHEYLNGKFFMMYDLTKSKRAATSGDVRPQATEGMVRLELYFDRELPASAYIVVASEYHTRLQIDYNRNTFYTPI